MEKCVLGIQLIEKTIKIGHKGHQELSMNNQEIHRVKTEFVKSLNKIVIVTNISKNSRRRMEVLRRRK